MGELDQQTLQSLLDYEPHTGLFFWLVNRGSVQKGDLAGFLDDKGYIRICINGRGYRAHRLAFLYMTGRWPKETIDHKDRVRTNNEWSNLREATHFEQGNNHSYIGNGLTKVRGVQFYRGKYRGQIWDNKVKKNFHIGTFDNLEDAKIAVAKARGRLRQ